MPTLTDFGTGKLGNIASPDGTDLPTSLIKRSTSADFLSRTPTYITATYSMKLDDCDHLTFSAIALYEERLVPTLLVPSNKRPNFPIDLLTLDEERFVPTLIEFDDFPPIKCNEVLYRIPESSEYVVLYRIVESSDILQIL